MISSVVLAASAGFAALDGQAYIGGGLGAMAVVAFIRWLLGDNSQVRLLRDEVNELRERQAVLEEENREQRSLKHGLSGDLAKSVVALEVVRKLSLNCECHALESVEGIVDQVLTELSTIHNRRAGDT